MILTTQDVEGLLSLASLKEATSFALLAFAFLWGLLRITRRLEDVSDSLKEVKTGMASSAQSMQTVAGTLRDLAQDVELLKDRCHGSGKM